MNENEKIALMVRLQEQDKELRWLRRYQLQMEAACRVGTATDRMMMASSLEQHRNLNEELVAERDRLKERCDRMEKVIKLVSILHQTGGGWIVKGNEPFNGESMRIISIEDVAKDAQQALSNDEVKSDKQQ